jgi:hypothetical protein
VLATSCAGVRCFLGRKQPTNFDLAINGKPRIPLEQRVSGERMSE